LYKVFKPMSGLNVRAFVERGERLSVESLALIDEPQLVPRAAGCRKGRDGLL
jgi:hypothetical protein